MATPEELAGARTAREILTWSRETVEPALRAAVDSLPDRVRRVAGYHLGWLDEEGRPAEAGGGKAIRPALALLAAEAVGGTAAAAVPAAVAVELTHNFSLLHDDLIDGDATRRHRPTAWTVFGLGTAVLTGSALETLAVDVLAASGHPAAQQATRTLTATVQNLLHGQVVDVDLEQRTEVELPECERMAEDKTGALLGCACALGALFGGGSPKQMHHLPEFGHHLGLAFQLVDDLLGIWGDPAVTGKPASSDLYSRKKSLPVVAALTSGTPAGHELADLYHRDRPLTSTEVAAAAALIERAGGRDWTRAQADQRLAQALHELRLADPTGRAAAELDALARLVTSRDR